MRAFDETFEIVSPLLGEINLRNMLGASAVSVALGIGTDAVVEGVRRCHGAPGRLEAVTGPAGVKVLVDYAHKPDALEAVLTALRALAAAAADLRLRLWRRSRSWQAADHGRNRGTAGGPRDPHFG